MIRRVLNGMVACAVFAVPASALAFTDPLAATDDATVIVTGRSLLPANPNVFGTVTVEAGVTVYGARWRRVSAADAMDPRLASLMAGARGMDSLGKLAFVQREVRRRIAWRRDLDGYRISDYWAEAGETLDRGYGDSEDIAILKMQALKAAGFNARDFYLSVGRDRSRGADTLLLVRVGSAFYALDDRSDRPMTSEEHAQFVPIITLGKGTAWLHGKRYAGRATARHPVIATRPSIIR